MRKTINPSDAPKAIGAYNQGIETDGLVFTSGQIGMAPDKGQMVDGGIDPQTEQALLNIDAILREVKLDRNSIVKLTVFVKDLNDFPSVNRAFENYFDGIDYPARSTVEVSELPLGALVEIECIAIK
jgi:2-iminobutanoate/2-iminopropanoate deaminase